MKQSAEILTSYLQYCTRLMHNYFTPFDRNITAAGGRTHPDQALGMRNDTKNLLSATTAPHVKLHCIYSTNRTTISSLKYDNASQFPDNPHILEDDLGDGTVGIRSLELCNSFSNYQSEPVFSYQANNASHVSILEDEEAFRYIGSVITEEAHIRTSKDIGSMRDMNYIPENVKLDVKRRTLNEKQKKDAFTELMRDSLIWELEKEHHRN